MIGNGDGDGDGAGIDAKFAEGSVCVGGERESRWWSRGGGEIVGEVR
jgi:hypothetical protein